MRIRFNEQLELLNVELIRMGALCEDAISAAMKALFDHDGEMAELAVSIEEEIDEKERSIENMCMKLLLQQQPVAGDLRVISSAMRMIADMERIGDQAEDIAEITKFINDYDITGGIYLKDMSGDVSDMVTDSIESFVKQDLELAMAVIEYDRKVDALFEKIRSELIEEIASKKGNAETCFDVFMISKYLERIGDHAVNIAEWVIYSITGRHNEKPLKERMYRTINI
ncbi:MAG: phosphate signaling complex protein PhoU [Firmicutes bacterium]|nr:phosphate signaling complex protein PhoU [Bacillota bacterium]